MMVVMAVMVAELHLYLTLSGNGACCQLISVILGLFGGFTPIGRNPRTSGGREQESTPAPQTEPVAATHAAG